MPKKKYSVVVSAEERAQLRTVITKGKQSTRTIRRAHILLLADEGQTDERIAHALHLSRATVERTRQRFLQDRLQALQERPRPGAKPKLDGKQAAPLIALVRPSAAYSKKRSEAPAALAARPQPPVLSVPCGAGWRPVARGASGTPWWGARQGGRCEGGGPTSGAGPSGSRVAWGGRTRSVEKAV